MNTNEKNHFKENWNAIAKQHHEMDSLTDIRIKNAIDQKIKKISQRRKIYWSAAAAIIIGFSLLFLYPSSESVEMPKSNQTFYSLDYTKSIHLPDGSTVVLQPHSKLILASDFGKTSRHVTFTGKATFDIAKDKTKAFYIDAKDFNVEVLGTKFFLDQTKGAEKVELFEGKVKINHHGEISYLLPNNVWLFDKKESIKTYNSTITQRDFSFDDEAFSSIIKELEIVYQIKITYPEQYATKRINGSFSGTRTEVLSAISYPFALKPEKISEHEIQLK